VRTLPRQKRVQFDVSEKNGFPPSFSTNVSQFELIRYLDGNALVSAMACRWLDEVTATNPSTAYHIALSGGRIAHSLFKCITDQSKQRGLSLTPVHFFWADERCVPPADKESNFAAAQQHLFQPLAIKPDQIHRIRGELNEAAAALAEAELRRIVPQDPAGQPILDMVFLGVGEDGHVASLFPNEPGDAISSDLVYRTVIATKPPPKRITMTYKTITAARQVWIHASGSGKSQSLKESLSTNGRTPLARVLQMRQQTLIFTDIEIPEH
jgi:6-phosphogluconolactonase